MESTTIARRIAATVLVIQFAIDLLVCPHSKVEESFQVQATHDLIYHGFSPILRHSVLGENITLPYDHVSFPGGKKDF
jgi:alpha-1,6-mannosyltransferase